MRGLGDWKPRLNTEFIDVSYTLYAHSLKVILYQIFQAPVF